MKFVKQSGFDFTKEELETVQEKMQLTEDELESLAGGRWGCSVPTGVIWFF